MSISTVLWREANLGPVDKSDEYYSEEEVIKAPKRKRVRMDQATKAPTKKKYVRGKQGRLEGLMNMPIDIFTEVSKHVTMIRLSLTPSRLLDT